MRGHAPYYYCECGEDYYQADQLECELSLCDFESGSLRTNRKSTAANRCNKQPPAHRLPSVNSATLELGTHVTTSH